MTEMKTMGEKNAKKSGQKMSRKEALESFKRISEMVSTRILRADRQRYVKSLKQAGVDPAKYLPGLGPDQFPSYTDEDLQKMLENEQNRYDQFWEEREKSLTHRLFDGEHDWIPECRGLVIKNEPENIVLFADAAEMLMLLSEPPQPAYYENERAYRMNCILENRSTHNLLRILHPDMLIRLIASLDGERLADTIHLNANLEARAPVGFINTIAKSMLELSAFNDVIERLGAHCIIFYTDSRIIIPALKTHGGPEGKAVAEQLIDYMKHISDSVKETLGHLGE